MSMRTYTLTALVTAVAATCALAAFNAWVDPYGVFRRLGWPNAGLPPVTWSRIAATERLADACDMAILGSSRGVFGFGTRPLQIGDKRLCNGSLGGTSMAELAYAVRFVVEETDTPEILFLADVLVFHDARGVGHDFGQSRLNPDRTSSTFALWTLTSLTALGDSLAMLGIQTPLFDAPPPELTPQIRNRRTVRVTLGRPLMMRKWAGPETSLAEFVDALDRAKAGGRKVTVVFAPIHALQLELYVAAGLWDFHKGFRRWVVAQADARGIEVWDFAGYHAPARTRMALLDGDPPNPWFADMTHQTMLLGHLVLERMLVDPNGAASVWDPAFGVRLTPEGMDAHLAALDAGREQWLEEQPRDKAWFDQVVADLFATDPAAQRDLAQTAARINAAWSVDGRRAPDPMAGATDLR